MADKEFDIKQFLAGLDLNESERQAAEAIFTKEKNVAEIKRGWSTVSEGSRLMTEAQQARTEADAVRAQAAADKAEAEKLRQEALSVDQKNKTWAEALKTYEADAQQTAIDKETLAAEKTAYETYLREIGVDPVAALSGRVPPRQPPPPPPNPQARVPGNEPPPSGVDPKFIERYEAFEKQAGSAVGLLARLPFEIEQLQLTHESLYGKRIPATKMGELQIKYLDHKNTQSLMDIAKEDLHFADREKELQEQAITERANQMAQEMYQKRIDELHLPQALIDRAEAAPIVQFHSKEFTENVKRSGDLAQGNIDQKQLDAFLAVDAELAQQGIRPSTA